MADALTDLNEMIERIRQEADAAGYARAWAEIREMATGKASVTVSPDQGAPKLDHTFVVSSVKDYPLPTTRASRGENRKYVEHAMRNSQRILNATEIQSEIRKTGRQIAYSSVTQSLGQLESDGVIFRGDDNRWRFSEQPALPEEPPEAF